MNQKNMTTNKDYTESNDDVEWMVTSSQQPVVATRRQQQQRRRPAGLVGGARHVVRDGAGLGALRGHRDARVHPHLDAAAGRLPQHGVLRHLARDPLRGGAGHGLPRAAAHEHRGPAGGVPRAGRRRGGEHGRVPPLPALLQPRDPGHGNLENAKVIEKRLEGRL